MKVLELDKVSYKYEDGKDYVFKNLSFSFEKGKVIAIKGRSGSGKTTLLPLLSGLERYQEGKILFNGKELNSINLDEYRSHYIGIVFQSFNLLPHLTALENVMLSMDISNLKGINKKETALELLESVGISADKVNRRILKLSGGEQQRVAIARSLSYHPEIILADEPTGNLDHDTENEIMNIFKRLAHEENKCVIIVTHSKNVSNQADVVFDLKKSSK